jgi:hypothetical protein
VLAGALCSARSLRTCGGPQTERACRRPQAKRLEATDAPVRFVINGGDNFYPAGVSSTADRVWQTEWGDFYNGIQGSMPSIPWYSVYGNHDYGEFNKACACDMSDAGDGEGSTDGKRACAQVQKHGQVHGGQRWYMPSMSYSVAPLPGVNLEIVALDLNSIDAGKSCPWIVCNREHCGRREMEELEAAHNRTNPGRRRTEQCTMATCTAVIQKRMGVAARLLRARIAAAEAAGTQLIVVTHYPSSWIAGTSAGGISFMAELMNPNVHIVYFGAHVHSTDNTTNVHVPVRACTVATAERPRFPTAHLLPARCRRTAALFPASPHTSTRAM